jgi:hypothetical protein
MLLRLRLRLTAAVNHHIIGITRKGTLREVPLHPCIKRCAHLRRKTRK